MTKPPSRSSESISAAELLYADLDPDLASTRRVLERFPEGHADWRPHEKSRTLAELATHVANIPNLGLVILEADGMDATMRPRIAPVLTVTELLEHFDKSSASLRAAVADTDFEALSQMWSIRAGPKVLIEHPRRVMLRTLVISHIVHHRAQLGVYYRLLGVPVPGVYGPSADDQPFA
jgi:uncharacterized damage-inducible protein DinB